VTWTCSLVPMIRAKSDADIADILLAPIRHRESQGVQTEYAFVLPRNLHVVLLVVPFFGTH